MSAEKVAGGFNAAGKVVSSLSPLLAAIPGVGPVLAIIGELVGEGLDLAGAGIALSAQQSAAIVAAVRGAIDETKLVRAETQAAHDMRTSDTQSLIDAEKKILDEFKGSGGVKIVEPSLPARGDATKPGG